jgi:plastocyanin
MNRVCILAMVLGIESAAGGPALTPSPTTQILMENGSPYYVPATVTVASGTPVRWDNPTPTHHTVTHNDCIKEAHPCLHACSIRGQSRREDTLLCLACRSVVTPITAVSIPSCAVSWS